MVDENARLQIAAEALSQHRYDVALDQLSARAQADVVGFVADVLTVLKALDVLDVILVARPATPEQAEALREVMT